MKLFDIELPSVKYMVGRIWEYAGLAHDRFGTPKLKYFLGYCKDSILYKCSAQDYYLYRFFLLNRQGKRQFVTLGWRMLYDKKNNDPEQTAVAMDKEETLVRFSHFISRDWCGLKYHNSPEEYDAFCHKHTHGIVKPLDNMGGAGIKIISTQDYQSPGALRDYCMSKHLLIEELIVQHPDLNRLYPHAVNTVRVLTNKGQIVGVALRLGAGGGNLDNAHAGGIYAEVDPENGIVITRAMNHMDLHFTFHPDTGAVIPGFRIPFWDEVIQLVQDACKLVDRMGLIGWDIAVTSTGPTIVEVNNWPGVELIESPRGHGIRRVIEK